MRRPPSTPPIVEKKRPVRSTAMALAVADLSNLLQAMAVTKAPLPLEVERALTQHFTHYFELGQHSADRTVFQLKQTIVQKDEDIRRLHLQVQDLQRELRLRGRR